MSILLCLGTKSISSLKVAWQKDLKLDEAIENEKRCKLCARVVKEGLNEPSQVIPLRYLGKRWQRLRLNWTVKTFLDRNPGVFDIYYDRINPKTQPVVFLHASNKLRDFLEEEKRIYAGNEALLMAKLCKLLLMSKYKVISADKVVRVERKFGFPCDVTVTLLPRYPQYFRFAGSRGEGKSFLELADCEPEFAKSVIKKRAEEESRLTGIRMRRNFVVKVPRLFPEEEDEGMDQGLDRLRVLMTVSRRFTLGAGIPGNGEENDWSIARSAFSLVV